jgi:hypothetical protein
MLRYNHQINNKCIRQLKYEKLTISEYAKTTIPPNLRKKVWNLHYANCYETKCSVCQYNQITPFNFSCGHKIAELYGGDTTIDNLVPICHLCNSSMGTHKLSCLLKLLNNKMTIYDYYNKHDKLFKHYYPSVFKMKIWTKYYNNKFTGKCSICNLNQISCYNFRIMINKFGFINNCKPCCNGCYKKF